MQAVEIRHTTEVRARLGRDIMQRIVVPRLTPDDHGKFIAIAVDHDDFEIAEKDIDAVKLLWGRHPSAEIWLERAGYPAVCRFRRRP